MPVSGRILQGSAAVATIVGAVIAVYALLEPAKAAVRLGNIGSSSPDFVDLATDGPDPIDVGGYQICEHDRGDTRENCCEVPAKSWVRPAEPLRTYFFSPKKGPPPPDTPGIVCARFGIRAGEVVVLYGRDGAKLDEKAAN
jgi:hypothetical protein